jgi:hypothetical protein
LRSCFFREFFPDCQNQPPWPTSLLAILSVLFYGASAILWNAHSALLLADILSSLCLSQILRLYSRVISCLIYSSAPSPRSKGRYIVNKCFLNDDSLNQWISEMKSPRSKLHSWSFHIHKQTG